MYKRSYTVRYLYLTIIGLISIPSAIAYSNLNYARSCPTGYQVAHTFYGSLEFSYQCIKFEDAECTYQCYQGVRDCHDIDSMPPGVGNKLVYIRDVNYLNGESKTCCISRQYTAANAYLCSFTTNFTIMGHRTTTQSHSVLHSIYQTTQPQVILTIMPMRLRSGLTP